MPEDNTENVIVVQRHNETYIKITTNPGIREEIADNYTFWADKYWFHPKFKDKKWDGKIRLFKSKRYLYSGLFENLESFADENGYRIVCDLENAVEFSKIEALEFLQNLKFARKGKPAKLRKHQLKTFINGIRDQRAFYIVATSGGKTAIFYLWARWLQMHGKKGVIIVPRTSLVTQTYKNFVEYSELDDTWNAEESCHLVYDGNEKQTEKPITISTWQSFCRLEKEDFKKYEFVLGDEGHGFTANSLKHIMENLVNAHTRIGMTGSLEEPTVHELVLTGLFGPIRRIISTRQLIDKGHASDTKIKALVLNWKREDKEFARKKDLTYAQELEFLILSAKRNNFIKNLALSLEKNTIILHRFKLHGQILYDDIKEAVKSSKRPVYWIYGGVATEDRDKIKAILEKENDCILIASIGTFSEGESVDNLHNVIIGTPVKKANRIIQIIGRSIRLHNDKEHSTIYDIGDDLSSKNYINHSLKHLYSRIQTYIKEEHNYRRYKIDM